MRWLLCNECIARSRCAEYVDAFAAGAFVERVCLELRDWCEVLAGLLVVPLVGTGDEIAINAVHHHSIIKITERNNAASRHAVTTIRSCLCMVIPFEFGDFEFREIAFRRGEE